MIHASLFSGIGGAELAAEWMGWHNVFHCEIQEFPRKVIEFWYPESISYEDITKTDFSEWRGKVDVLTAGFPCQPYSVAGKRKGANDDRYLWPEMLRAIRQIQPTWVVGENVAGILSMVQPGEEVKVGSKVSLFGESDDVFETRRQFISETICTDLEREGYSVQPFVIPACAVGAPHKRDRVWFIARLAEDSVGNGCNRRTCKCEEEPQKWQQRMLGTGDSQRTCVQEEKPVADSCYSGDESLRKRQAEILASKVSANSKSKRRNASQYDDGQPQGTPKEECFAEQFGGADCPQNWWRDFPSVSPVCGGNDGLPFDVSRLTIPFVRWRQESIKALGNSMVPQVVYEIFRAIENI